MASSSSSSSSPSPLAAHFLAQMSPASASSAPLIFGINSLPQMFTYEEMNAVLQVSKEASKCLLPLAANRPRKNARKERRWDPKSNTVQERMDLQTRIFHATKTHNTARVLELIEIGADLSLTTIDKETLLFVACYSKAPAEIIKALLNAHYWDEKEVFRCLDIGAYSGAPSSTLEALLPYCKTDLKYFFGGHSPLHWLSRAGMDHSFIPTLIAASPKMVTGECDHFGQLPLHLAMWHNLPLEVIKMLVEPFPRTIHTKDISGKSPLDMAKDPKYKTIPEVLEYMLSLA